MLKPLVGLLSKHSEMIGEGADLVKITKLTIQQTERITCLECCKYYIAPETAACGHTLCHSCWKGQRSCPVCKQPLERKALKPNLPVQTLTEHVHQLIEAFEKLFNIKLDEYAHYTPTNVESEKDPTKHVKEWLASSQNNFSAPLNSDKFSQETELDAALCAEVTSSKIQIHTNIKKIKNPEKVLHVPVPPQDDWDKIETLPDTENVTKNKENIVGPMDIEPYFFDDNEYTTENPRRSSRKKDITSDDHLSKAHDISADKHNSKDSSGEMDKKSNKIKQNWGNVKKMRKEFSKLNKINKNKLNVSIEMCKKTQIIKPSLPAPLLVSQHPMEIDENSPCIDINRPDNIEGKPIFEHEDNSTNFIIRDDNNIADNCIREINESSKRSNPNTDSNEKKIEDINNKNLLGKKHVETSRKSNKKVDKCDKDKFAETVRMPFFKKGALYHKCNEENLNDNDSKPEDTDNIEITIKIGSTIANIVIKQKEKDVQLKVNTDREIQTNLGPHILSVNNITKSNDVDVQTVNICLDENTNKIDVQSLASNLNNDKISQRKQVLSNLNKSFSTKKNTASAETVTELFEITESIEKELSNAMECGEALNSKQIMKKCTNYTESQSLKEAKQNPTKIISTENMEYLNDVDIFYSGSVKETNVQLLKNSKNASSEILESTVMAYKDKQKHPDKRERDTNDDDEMPSNKKLKCNFAKKIENKLEICEIEKDCSGNYDAIMGQVFARIDADIVQTQKSLKVKDMKSTDKGCTQNPLSVQKKKDNMPEIALKQKNILKDIAIACTSTSKECFNEKCSENVFSIIEKDKEVTMLVNQGPANTEQHIQDLLTPVSVRGVESQIPIRNQDDIMVDREESTPYQEQDDSDKSIVEETPQKNLSFSKLKQKSNVVNQSQRLDLDVTKPTTDKQLSDAQYKKSNINLSNSEISVETSKSTRDINETAQNQMLETPLSIDKFVDQIKHKSTPVAKKSLNFKQQNDDERDPEQTLCPTACVVAKTTQEKEFLSEAFENTLSPAIKNVAKSIYKEPKKLCIAGSCLTSTELMKIKSLCLDRKWTYSDKYTKEVTHLVVGVDNENKSQRSVKYMCSLAAGKWIVSFEWIEKMLKTKNMVDEASYEALDSTGEPGPRRSRVASNRNQKLFNGITFYCMPPFSVLDVDTLQCMLEAAGGRVVHDTSEVRVSDGSRTPALLLAEPEHTQEDRLIYLAMELCIVPVNYEWALNCLGSYTLASIQELLLCPASLLPAPTANWPHVLLARED